MSTETKDLFENRAGHQVGVVTIDPQGQHEPIAVLPNDTVWLSEAEQILTANAPRDDADNPLVNGKLVLVTAGQDLGTRRPLRPTEAIIVEEVGTPVAEQPKAEVGTRPATEETGTPTPAAPAPAPAPAAPKPQSAAPGNPKPPAGNAKPPVTK